MLETIVSPWPKCDRHHMYFRFLFQIKFNNISENVNFEPQLVRGNFMQSTQFCIHINIVLYRYNIN